MSDSRTGTRLPPPTDRRHATASIKLKAMVTSRLLMGHFDAWTTFAREMEVANQIHNGRMARNVAAQIGRRYGELRSETTKFMDSNFNNCSFDEMARLGDCSLQGQGVYLPLDQFEREFFLISEPVKRVVPTYAHVSISTFGLQFEFPEIHFLNDIQSCIDNIESNEGAIQKLKSEKTLKLGLRDTAHSVVAHRRFLCRSLVSASFSLVEAYLSGLFFSALKSGIFNGRVCDPDLTQFFSTKESASLKIRLNRIAAEISPEVTGAFPLILRSFLEEDKPYRDAIHHTTPFERRQQGRSPGDRLLDLYKIDEKIALRCTANSLDIILMIARAIGGNEDESTVVRECTKLSQRIRLIVLTSVK